MCPQQDLFDAVLALSEERVRAALDAGASPSDAPPMNRGLVVCSPLGLITSIIALTTPSPAWVNITRMLVEAGATVEALSKAQTSLVQQQFGRPGIQLIRRYQLEIIKKALQVTNQAKTLKVAVPNPTVSAWKKLLFSEKFSDIKFVFPEEDGAILHAHRNILAASSPYFDTYFDGPWGEAHPDGVWETKNPLSVMKAILSFLYTGDLAPMEKLLRDQQDSSEILTIVAQYELPSLKDLVGEHMKKSLSLETLKDTLCTAHLHGLSDLKTASIDYLYSNWEDAMFGDHSIADIKSEDPDLWKEIGVAVGIKKREAKASTEEQAQKRARLATANTEARLPNTAARFAHRPAGLPAIPARNARPWRGRQQMGNGD